MSREIFLYSEDKKYKCAIELADSLDRFGCPDHSMMVLFEEREDGTYIIAQARDRRLETEKDTLIASLELEKNNLARENAELKQQLAEKEKEIEYFKKQAKKFNNEAQKYFEDAYCNDTLYQDKISFCIEQLEKVKEWCKENRAEDEFGYYVIYVDEYVGAEQNLLLHIDNLIKEIKGE